MPGHSESDLKTELIKSCRKAGAYARRIEDQYAVGILDMVIVFPGEPVVFAEGKIMRTGFIRPTERQFLEGDKIQKLQNSNVLAVLIGWREQRMYVGGWGEQLSMSQCLAQGEETYGQLLKRWLNNGRFAQPSSS